MQYVNLKEMAKQLKRKEEEVMVFVNSDVIKTDAYCYPSGYGDGHDIAFYPEKVLAYVKPLAKAKAKEKAETK